MSWIKPPYIGFPRRTANVLIGLNDLVDMGVHIEYGNATVAPEDLEAKMRIVVETFHPKLKGCTFWSMNFDFQMRCWSLGVIHPSLAVVELFQPMPNIRLIEDPIHEDEFRRLLASVRSQISGEGSGQKVTMFYVDEAKAIDLPVVDMTGFLPADSPNTLVQPEKSAMMDFFKK